MFEGLRLQHWRHQQTEQGLIHLIMDKAGESANTFSRQAMNELGQLLERLAIEPPAGVLILSGKPSGFIAGADVKEFEAVAQSGDEYATIRNGQRVFDALANLPCATAAAIDGFCMGGGTELALACDYRVASNSDNTRIGLPEVMLGIHPGWGGTVRLPTLVGPLHAMDMMLTGRGLRPQAARNIGLVDRVVEPEQLIPSAERMLTSRPAPARASWYLRLLNHWPARPVLAQVLRRKTRAKVNPKHYPSPFAIINLWNRYAGASHERRTIAEARSMVKMARTQTAANLTRVFFLREAARSLGDAEQCGIERVHVIGAGVMGGDIAAWCVLRGLSVTLQDREEQYVQPALERAGKLFKKRLKTPERIEDASSRLRMDVAGDGVADADLVLEAIFENLEAKQALLKDLEPKMKSGAILATNTSSIPLQDLGQALKQPQRLVGLHFFNPVAQMPLLEIVTHPKLDESVLERAGGFSKLIDKVPVKVTSSPGFLVNRILMPYMLEAMLLYGEGVPGAVIDKAAVRFGMPMGPVELADQVGLDVAASVSAVLSEHLGLQVPEGLGEMVEAGKRGRKDGVGFYEYPEGKPVKPEIPEGYTAPADLTDRLVMAYLNMAVTCLREGVVESPEMLDTGLIFGTGFPPFRGGAWKYIQDTGPAVLKQKLETLTAAHGDRFAPDPGWDTL